MAREAVRIVAIVATIAVLLPVAAIAFFVPHDGNEGYYIY